MTTFALVVNKTVVAVVESNPIFDVLDTFDEKLPGNEVLEIDTVVPMIGDTIEGVSGKVSKVASEGKGERVVSKAIFLSRFTAQEIKQIRTSVDEDVEALVYIIEHSDTIDLESPVVKGGLAVLESKSVLTVGRKEVIGQRTRIGQ